MNPLFFGSSSRPLFGAYHPPRKTLAHPRGIVVCQAVGQEYMRAHWASRQLARRLADDGAHVLRFDYSATGDSAGASRDARVARWRDDVAAACAELRDLGGVDTVSLVGVRLGATLATLATAGRGVDELVLWDPIVSGAAHVRTLSAMHAALARDPMRFRRPRPVPAGELCGFPMPAALRDELVDVDLLAAPLGPVRRALVLSTSGDDEHTRLAERLRGHAEHVTTATAAPIAWHDISRFEDQLLAPDAIATIGDFVAASGAGSRSATPARARSGAAR